jgi:hypothetical protein
MVKPVSRWFWLFETSFQPLAKFICRRVIKKIRFSATSMQEIAACNPVELAGMPK